jgi:hypothetical protein
MLPNLKRRNCTDISMLVKSQVITASPLAVITFGLDVTLF